MKTETWCDHKIRFIEHDGEWWAILKDICDALGLRTDKVSQRLDSDMLTRVAVEVSDNPSGVDRSPGENKTRQMLAVNEMGIYEALFASRKLEARKFRRWSAKVMTKLRSSVGLQGYEVMRMTEPEIQAAIDEILDCLFWDEEDQMLKISKTVAGGDVIQLPFYSEEEE
jgi:prophage antirepressor-like protein